MLRMTVEQALTWAYRDELPKAGAPGRLRGPRLATPGWVRAAETWAGRIDASNEYGLMPDFGALGPPHRAAIALDALVHCLDRLSLDATSLAPLQIWSFDDQACAGLVRAAVERVIDERMEQGVGEGGMVPRGTPAELLRRAALIGPPCGWQAPCLSLKPVMAADGRRKWFRPGRVATAWDKAGRPAAWAAIEVDGWDARGRRPYADAYQKYQLSHDPAPAARARLDWCIWAAALEALDSMARTAIFVFGAERVNLGDLGVELLPHMEPHPPWTCEYSRAGLKKDLCSSPVE